MKLTLHRLSEIAIELSVGTIEPKELTSYLFNEVNPENVHMIERIVKFQDMNVAQQIILETEDNVQFTINYWKREPPTVCAYYNNRFVQSSENYIVAHAILMCCLRLRFNDYIKPLDHIFETGEA